MTTITRVKKILEKLNIGNKQPIEYWSMITIDKDKTFEQSCKPPCGFNNAWCNNTINANQGKNYLGLFKLEEKPKVFEKIKEIYNNIQKNLINDHGSGCALYYLTLIENENGELIVKK